MNFKVGQRVRVIASHAFPGIDRYIGVQGTIWLIDTEGRFPVDVRLDGHGLCPFAPSELAPLNDPGADAFMERIKKLKPYDEPTRKSGTTVADLVNAALKELGL